MRNKDKNRRKVSHGAQMGCEMWAVARMSYEFRYKTQRRWRALGHKT